MIRQIFALALLYTSQSLWGATYVVDTTIDNTSTLFLQCTAAPNNCSLRGAVQKANANPGPDVIEFNVPAIDDAGCDSVSGGCRFNLSGMPLSVSEAVSFDGYTQPGAQANTIPASQGEMNASLKIELLNGGGSAILVAQQNGGLIDGLLSVQGLIFGVHTNAIGATNLRSLTVHGCWFNSALNGQVVDGGGSLTYVTNGDSGTPYIVRIGGLLPEQRNWFPNGNVNLTPRASFNQSPTFDMRIEGNLFGAARDAMTSASAAAFRFYSGISFSPPPAPNSLLLIGGTDPNARNIFAGIGYGIVGGGVNNNVAIVKIQGNYFGVGKDGVTSIPLQFGVDAEGATVGGQALGEGNLFVGNPSLVKAASKGVTSPGRMRVLGNRFRNHLECALCNPEEGSTFLRPNDPGDADAYGFTGNTLQNYPEITAVSQNGAQLSVTYRVTTASTNAVYPLDIEFYKAAGWEGEEILGRDVYSTPELEKTVVLTIPAGTSFNAASDMVLASTNAAAPLGGFSRFSWHPIVLTFLGNAPLSLNTPTSVRVRAQSIWSPYTPRGQVSIDFGGLGGGTPCTLNLQPTANPGVAEGNCQITATSIPFSGISQLTASFRVQTGIPFGGEDGRVAIAMRNAAVIQDNLFCHGFEDNSNGTCRPLP